MAGGAQRKRTRGVARQVKKDESRLQPAKDVNRSAMFTVCL
jgi:hypothetical protein